MKFDKRYYYTNGFICDAYLRPDQLLLYELIKKSKKVVSLIHRRYGKSSTNFAYIFERMANEEIPIRYGCPTLKMAREVYNTISSYIFRGVEDLAPKWDSTKDAYIHPKTGATLRLFGGKDSAEIDKAGRGGEAKLIYVDEFGFFKYKAEYLLKSVLSPQLDTFEGSQLLITSTMPDDLTHCFVDEVLIAEQKGYLFEWTLDDSLKYGVIDQSYYDDVVEWSGGKESDAFQREYLCRRIPPSSRLIIPEVQGLKDDWWLGVQNRPKFFKPLVMIDLGLKDYTCALFGYVDFKQNKLIIEKEYYKNYTTTKTMVQECMEIEKELGYEKPFRQGDNQLQQLFDMSVDYRYEVAPIIKQVKGLQDNTGYRDSCLNNLRINLSRGRILINPDSCPNLVRHIKYGIWNETRTDFERSDGLGHWDAGMTLAYMNYHADWATNPYPMIDMDDFRQYKREEVFIVPELLQRKSIRDIL